MTAESPDGEVAIDLGGALMEKSIGGATLHAMVQGMSDDQRLLFFAGMVTTLTGWCCGGVGPGATEAILENAMDAMRHVAGSKQ